MWGRFQKGAVSALDPYLQVMELRDTIRKILRENLPMIGQIGMPQNTFPYGPEQASEPQQIDPLTDYVLDWDKFSTNHSVFEFPKDEFDLGVRIERNKDPKAQILDIAEKVIEVLRADPQFYSALNSRRIQ